MCGRFIYIPKDELNRIIEDVKRNLRNQKNENVMSSQKDVYPSAQSIVLCRTINIVIPFVIVFLTPLYGIRILGVSHIFAQIIMAVIAAIYVACGFYGFFRREKGK